MAMPGWSDRLTEAVTSIPWVTSASSPPSFCTEHTAPDSVRARPWGQTSTVQPLGVSRERVSGAWPVSSSRAAPAAARAAQVPVV